MKKIFNKEILVLSVFGVLLLIFTWSFIPKSEFIVTQNILSSDVQEKEIEIKKESKDGLFENIDKLKIVEKTAIFKVDNSEFKIVISDNTTVYDVMKILVSENKINFEAKEYPGLGFFVTKINSLQSGNGKNLMYYINGKEASVGISSYIIKEGDTVEWKLI